jgi:hypothetical protein
MGQDIDETLGRFDPVPRLRPVDRGGVCLDPGRPLRNDGLRCTATSKQSGERCRRPPIAGGFVCQFHGGASKTVQDAARARLRAMVSPALAALLRAIDASDAGEPDAATSAVAVRAAQIVLDRTGYGPRSTVALERGADEDLASLSDDELANRAARLALELSGRDDGEPELSRGEDGEAEDGGDGE